MSVGPVFKEGRDGDGEGMKWHANNYIFVGMGGWPSDKK